MSTPTSPSMVRHCCQNLATKFSISCTRLTTGWGGALLLMQISYKLKPFRKSSRKPFLALSLNLSRRPAKRESFLRYSRSGSLLSWSASSYPLSKQPAHSSIPSCPGCSHGILADSKGCTRNARSADHSRMLYKPPLLDWVSGYKSPAKATRPVRASSSLE